MERRGEVGPAEPFSHDAIHMRNHSVHSVTCIHPDNGADPDGRVEGSPEVEFVRRVGATFRGDDSAENLGHGAPWTVKVEQ